MFSGPSEDLSAREARGAALAALGLVADQSVIVPMVDESDTSYHSKTEETDYAPEDLLLSLGEWPLRLQSAPK